MRILYMSCHAILEYDELKLFEELGIPYFSLGSYLNPQKPVDPIRPKLKQDPDDRLISIAPRHEELTDEFLEPFDTIIVMHKPEWIIKNWDKIKDKKVIWRSIGQSTPEVERSLWEYRQKGLKVVRYSPLEANISNTIGCDKVIRFYKDENEFKGWKGVQREIMTIAQNMKHRGEHCNYQAFIDITMGFPTKLYGTTNESSGLISGGYLTFNEMKQKLRDNRVYIYTGTQPASYTLGFIEAWMTGIPIVAIGNNIWNNLNIAGNVYEVPSLIKNASSGFVSDDVGQLREYVNALLDDDRLRQRISQTGRKAAIEHFGKEVIKQKWKEFLCQ